MSIFDITNFTPLDDNLFTSGQPTEAQFAELARQGLQVVINLALQTSTNALPDEAGTLQSLGLEYIHIPVVWEEPQLSALEQFFAAMENHQAKNILVHCALNYRASAFTALWRVLKQGWEPEKAFAAQRSIWNLDEYPVWKTFVEQALETHSKRT